MMRWLLLAVLTPSHSQVVAAQVATAQRPESVDAGELERAQALHQRGSTLFDSADYAGAIEAFTEALTIVPNVEGSEWIRLSLLYNIASAHERAYKIDHDVSPRANVR